METHFHHYHKYEMGNYQVSKKPKFLLVGQNNYLLFLDWWQLCQGGKSISEVRAVVGAIVAKKLGVDCITVSHEW